MTSDSSGQLTYAAWMNNTTQLYNHPGPYLHRWTLFTDLLIQTVCVLISTYTTAITQQAIHYGQLGCRNLVPYFHYNFICRLNIHLPMKHPVTYILQTCVTAVLDISWSAADDKYIYKSAPQEDNQKAKDAAGGDWSRTLRWEVQQTQWHNCRESSTVNHPNCSKSMFRMATWWLPEASKFRGHKLRVTS